MLRKLIGLLWNWQRECPKDRICHPLTLSNKDSIQDLCLICGRRTPWIKVHFEARPHARRAGEKKDE